MDTPKNDTPTSNANVEHAPSRHALPLDEIYKLSAQAHTLRIPSLDAQLFTLYQKYREKPRLQIAFAGEFNHGKSSVINTILGQNILPTGMTPTTLKTTRITPQNTQHNDDTQSTIPTSNDTETQTLYYNEAHALLDLGVDLIDTPGVNDISDQTRSIDAKLIERCAYIVFVLDAGQILKESERKFLALHAQHADKFMIIINKIDLMPYIPFKMDYFRKGVEALNTNLVSFPLSCATSEGIDEWVNWLIAEIEKNKA